MSPEYYHITDELLVKYLLGEASAPERAQVDAWLALSDANRLYLAQLQQLWEGTDGLAYSGAVDEEAAWQRLRTRLHAQPAQGRIGRSGGVAWWRIAALLVLVAGTALLAYTWLSRPEPVQPLSVRATIVPLSDTLSDGSVVTLNKHSVLRYPSRFEGGSRSIALQGEAFFAVTPDKKKPFIVQAGEVTIRVVGTSFNVRSEGGETEVIVESGVVQVSRGGKTIELHPKEKVLVRSGDSALVKRPESETLYNYYRTREFVCDNTPLWKLVQVLNEAYDSHIVIDRAQLRTLPLTTTFTNESLDHILEVIAITFDISVVHEGNTIHLR